MDADRAYAAALQAQGEAQARAELLGRAAARRARETAPVTEGGGAAAPAPAAAAKAAAPAPAAAAKAVPKAKAAARAPPRQVAGPLPWPVNRQGRAYYLLRDCHPEGPSVSVGHEHTLAILGGSWFNHGGAPEGFGDLYSAVNALLLLLPSGVHEVRVIFPPQALWWEPQQ